MKKNKPSNYYAQAADSSENRIIYEICIRALETKNFTLSAGLSEKLLKEDPGNLTFIEIYIKSLINLGRTKQVADTILLYSDCMDSTPGLQIAAFDHMILSASYHECFLWVWHCMTKSFDHAVCDYFRESLLHTKEKIPDLAAALDDLDTDIICDPLDRIAIAFSQITFSAAEVEWINKTVRVDAPRAQIDETSLVRSGAPSLFNSALGDIRLVSKSAIGTFESENLSPAPRLFTFSTIGQEFESAISRGAWLGERVEELTSSLMERLEGYETLSLDVFDTFLLRGPESEVERYLCWARFVLASLADGPYEALGRSMTPEGLTVMRAKALELSYRFRKRIGSCAEGSIREVARNLALSLGQDQALARKLLALETKFETMQLQRNPLISKVVGKFHRRGGRVILISDMYLHSDMIETICRHVDPDGMRNVDQVISSADTIVNKRSGRIYGMVTEMLCLNPSRTIHIGDNFRSDVQMARLAGWHAMHFPISRPELAAREMSLATTVAHFDQCGIDVRTWAKC